ncbi:glyoxalase domain-containing protein 5, partial [Aulographum hederae CBS 113979]
ARFSVKALDHIVLTVRSIPATIKFYEQHLGMKHEAFTSPKEKSIERHALLFGSQKINLHQARKEFEPKAASVQPGSGDICFLTDTPVEDVLKEYKSKGLEVLQGGEVVDRTGAVGPLRSVYVRDPDGNLVE